MDMRLPWRTDRRDLLLAGLIAVGLLGLFVAVQRVSVSSYDSKIALATARAIAAGHLHLDPADDYYKRNLPYSHYGIGTPLLILPLYLLQRALRLRLNLLTTLANPLLLAACGGLLVLCGRELGWSRRLSLATGLVFGALTMALQASEDVLSEPGVAFGTALVVLGMLRWRAGRVSGSWLAGLGVGAGLLFRSDSALLLGVGLLLLPALVPWRRLLRERWAWVGLALPILAAALWTS
jgi:4-amino-4-deoxy-L-arabinose transferase-like glycosyltransferase